MKNKKLLGEGKEILREKNEDWKQSRERGYLEKEKTKQCV